MSRILLGVALFCVCFSTQAAIDAYQFPDESLRVRYNQLIDELRCPQCLNTNIAGSDAMIARNLRSTVHQQLLQGKSDEEILSSLRDSYGDFILYNPRVVPSTYLLWFGPVLLFLLAAGAMFSIIRRRRGVETEEVDSDRLQAMLSSARDKD
jgi:cytochrome c-type biogenesis protein CcmH